MNTLYPIFEPLFDFWNYLTHDEYFAKLTKFTGGNSQGSEWHSKYLKAEMHKVTSRIDYLYKQFNEAPCIWDVLWDNKGRLTVLAGFERLIAFRQAQSILGARFTLHNNNGSVMNAFFNKGPLRGFFRGYMLHLAQFVSVQYHSLLISHNTSLANHILVSSLIETAFYPLDTVKTIIYADLNKKYANYRDCLRSILTNNGISHLYRGLAFKLSYNVLFLVNLRNMYEGSNLTYLTLPLWLLSYSLLSIKTCLQVCDTKLSYASLKSENMNKIIMRLAYNNNLFSGLVPFAALNLLFSYTFYSLYSEEAKNRALFEPISELEHIIKLTRK